MKTTRLVEVEVDEPVEGYTWEELAEKIDWEGGMHEFFLDYISADKIKEPELKTLVFQLAAASKALEAYLEEHGGIY